MLRVALFTVTGVISGVRSLQAFTDPAYMRPVTAADWFAVLSFSAGLFALAFALPMFAQLIGGRVVFRVSLVPAAGAALAGFSNLLEDALQMDFAFWFFIAGAMLSLVGLIAFTIVAAAGGRGRHRLFAAVPAATLVGQLTFSVGGGVLIMAAWLAVAAMAFGQLRPTAAEVSTPPR